MQPEDPKTEYPKMLYQGGDSAAEWVIVEDEAAHAEANKAGYAEPGETTKKTKAKGK